MKICIEVSGGAVQNVYAIDEYAVTEPDLDVTICDFDIIGDYTVEEEDIEKLHNELNAFRAHPKCYRVW